MSIPKLSKILYVEDDPSIQEVVCMSLEDIGGYELKICNSGDEALASAPEFKPDMFLLDVMMPDMDGPTVLRELRKIPEFAQTPAVFITAKVQMHEMAQYKEYGVLGIIRKPFDPISISDTIKDLWNEFYSN